VGPRKDARGEKRRAAPAARTKSGSFKVKTVNLQKVAYRPWRSLR
jgi:hypothetical protein